MLTLHRRHTDACEHASKGWNYTLCQCPIWADGKLNGSRFRKSLDTTSWERATRRAQILESGGDLAPEAGDASQTVKSAVAAFLKDCEKRNLAGSTIATYTRTLNHLAKRLGERAIAFIDVATLDRIDRELKPRTRRMSMAVKNTAILAGETRPASGLRDGHRRMRGLANRLGNLYSAGFFAVSASAACWANQAR
jgi:hypothetical protein